MTENINKSGIYCIENIKTNKKYIGQSVDIKDRWRRHISELNKGTHENDYLQKAWNKYTESNFRFYVLEYCHIDKLDEIEVYYIEKYNTLNRDLGYNLKSGGQNGGSKYSDEVRKKMSASVKQSYDENLKQLRSQTALNQWADPNIKEKIMGSNNGMHGKHHTEEAIGKIKEKRKNVKKKKEIRRVLCVELNMIFSNASQAAKYFNMTSAANILNVCYGKRQTCGGYHWKFVDKEEE